MQNTSLQLKVTSALGAKSCSSLTWPALRALDYYWNNIQGEQHLPLIWVYVPCRRIRIFPRQPQTAEGVNFDYFERLISGICNILVILLSPNKMQLLQQLLRLWRDKESFWSSWCAFSRLFPCCWNHANPTCSASPFWTVLSLTSRFFFA